MSVENSAAVSKEVLLQDITQILKQIMRDQRDGRSRTLADMKALYSGNLALEFPEYFKFLNKYNYVLLKEGRLILSDKGIAAAADAAGTRIIEEIEHFFGNVIIDAQEDIEEIKEVPTPTPIRQDPKYLRLEQIGSGVIGSVYKGKHTITSHLVAIKEIKDLFSYYSFIQRSEVVIRLKDELSLAASLSHPCIINIVDVNLEASVPYFIIEYAPRGNLRQYIGVKSEEEIRMAIKIFLQICYALHYAHRQGIVHQNLKPENILFTAQNNVKISDFGMNRIIRARPGTQIPHVFIGAQSIAYQPPEILAGNEEVIKQSDIYSLGIIFYEMLTGFIPGRRSQLPSEVVKGLPSAIDKIFDKMTRDRIEERYEDFEQVLDDFYSMFKDEYGKMGEIVLSDPIS
ncbi:MAG: serine/threonine protein kinase [Deltaproteobacteria bacterium]|nr:serine/threonine protein kinase [Deltaproteobacteria bacterium]